MRFATSGMRFLVTAKPKTSIHNIGNRAGRQRSIGSTKQRSKHTKRHRPSTVPLMESCRHWPSFQRNLTDCLIRNAKTAKFSLNITRNFAIFVISKPTSIPSYPMRIMRPIYTTTLYLPNPISTAAVNLWSDRRKPYAFLRQKRLGIGLFSFGVGVSPNGECASILHNRRACSA